MEKKTKSSCDRNKIVTKTQKRMKVAFFEWFLNIRGTSTAIYDYAHYNEMLLHNESIVITQALHLATHEDACAKVYEKFQKRFPVFFLDNENLCDEIQKIVDREKPDVLYMLWKGGIRHVFRNVKTFAHCVFDPQRPYGDAFCVISEWLNLAYHANYPVVPHIVSLPEINGNLREELGIPVDAVVFGRYGGLREFDHPAAHEAVKRLSVLHPHIYFLFMNTAVFLEPAQNVLFLDKSSDSEYKARFIDTCDAMLYARSRGETFGLAIAEFSSRNKPIFAPRDAPEQMHKHILKENAYWYTDADDLCALLEAFRPDAQKNWDCYESYSPERVMALFQEQLAALTRKPPTACLAIIMKNEGPLLPRLFESVRGFVTEYCVVDTGSTDDTIDVLKSMDMPGTIHEEPFVDFATTRNFLLEKCRQTTKSDYLLLLDADMVLCVSPEWDWAKVDTKVDVYSVIQVSSLEYENVRLIRTDAVDVKVVGSTHEYYSVPSHYRQAALPKDLVYIKDWGDGKCKDDKYSRDERLLKRELAADNDNPRTVFYLANTLRDQGKYAEAIPYYVKRTQMVGGFFAEADLSYTCLVQCYLGLDDVANAEKYASIAAYERTVPRAEAFYYLSFYLHGKHKYDLAWYYANMAGKITKPLVSQALFIHNDIYDFWIDYEKATLSQHVFPTDLTVCMHKAFHFLNNGFVPEYLRKMFIEATLAKYT